jgi:hypothetical protein
LQLQTFVSSRDIDFNDYPGARKKGLPFIWLSISHGRRTATYYDEHVPESSVDILGHSAEVGQTSAANQGLQLASVSTTEVANLICELKQVKSNAIFFDVDATSSGLIARLSEALDAAADLPAARCAQSIPSAVIGIGVERAQGPSAKLRR